MPLSSEPLKAERRGAVNRFFAIIKDEMGGSKKAILAKGRLILGSKRTTIYDYYETLRDAGLIVEEDGLVYTKKFYEETIQERLRVAHEKEIAKEIALTSVQSLDGYDTSKD